MTDRELLELAAKAAGIDVYESTDGTMQNRPVLVFAAGGGMGTMLYEERWNPLQCDAQALRLAVKLNIECVFSDDRQAVNAGVWSEDPKSYDCMVPYGGDKQAATRRAIVRAAAEIGKEMKG